MYKLLRASVFQLCTRTSLKRVSRAVLLEADHDGTFGRTAAHLSSHTHRPSARTQPHLDSHRYTVVEPQRPEEFVFLDCEEEEDALDDGEAYARELQQLQARPKASKLREKPSRQRAPRGLELQMKHMESSRGPEDAPLDFQDAGFPLEPQSERKKIHSSPDTELEQVSGSVCGGCGALLHCTDARVPGYLPAEKHRALLEGELRSAVCQRCFLITHQQRALQVCVSPDEYRALLRRIRSERALVLLILDLLDLPDSIIPDLPELVGRDKHIVVLGNKVDLLPGDAENYLQRIRRQLMQDCAAAGIRTSDPRDFHLISAKTGYGVESLISRLQSRWKYKGDVYLVGTANAGKSTLFNTLLESDYCKSRASDVIHRATISPWPGTTLNLLKFPIINPTPHRMFRRAERLKRETELEDEEQRRIRSFSRQGYLIGHVGRTFRASRSRSDLVEFDPDSLSLGTDLEEQVEPNPAGDAELSHNETKDAHWLYDTPGIMKEHDVLSLLTEQEVKLVVPTRAITPRTFVMKPGMVLFLGALARFDYLEGTHSCWFSVVASSRVPVHITSLEKADGIYQKHAGHTLLAVPCGGEERMQAFPPLESQDFELQGRGSNTAVADIKLSSAGWVAVTAVAGERVVVRAHAPAAAALSLRSPPLLPHIVELKGRRIHHSPAYKPRKPAPLLDTGLSAAAAQRDKNKNKIK